MAKEQKPKTPAHKCRRVNFEKEIWRTACGLKLSKAERKDVVLADDWEFVTCKACKKEKPREDED